MKSNIYHFKINNNIKVIRTVQQLIRQSRENIDNHNTIIRQLGTIILNSMKL